MNIAYIKWDWAVEHSDVGTNRLVQDWVTALRAAKIDTMMFPVGPGKIMLLSTETEYLKKARKYILEQEEIDFYVAKNRTFYPISRDSPLTDLAERERLGAELNVSSGIDMSIFENMLSELGSDEL
jgi:hypothetical protein